MTPDGPINTHPAQSKSQAIAGVAAVVLAAGAGTRMGHRPKCLLELNGVPLIVRLCRALRQVGVNEVVVVLGHHAPRIAPVLHGLALTQVVHPSPDDGPATSLRLGLQALPTGAASPAAVLVALADQPLVGETELRALVHAYQERPGGTDFVVPFHAGQPGNPVVFSADVMRQLLDAPQALAGQQWRNTHPEKVHRWVTDSGHFGCDLDSTGDIDSLAREAGIQLLWPLDLAR